MLSFLPATLTGIIASLLYFLNFLIFPTFVVITGILSRILPAKVGGKIFSYLAHDVFASLWVDTNNLIAHLTTKTKVIVHGNGKLHRRGWYLVIANHQSWIDILILQRIFIRKIPFLKFFIKQSLLWKLPIAGLGCWALGFPLMRRYSKDYLKKHPEKKGKDFEETRKACRRFKNEPVSVFNFLEGTRFTFKKKQRQHSPYQHLLRPKAGGIGFVLGALQGSINELINVTIVYPDGNSSLWRYLCGHTSKIVVHYEVLPVPDSMRGDYQNNIEFRKQFQAQLNQLWQEKDKLISEIIAKEHTQ